MGFLQFVKSKHLLSAGAAVCALSLATNWIPVGAQEEETVESKDFFSTSAEEVEQISALPAQNSIDETPGLIPDDVLGSTIQDEVSGAIPDWEPVMVEQEKLPMSLDQAGSDSKPVELESILDDGFPEFTGEVEPQGELMFNEDEGVGMEPESAPPEPTLADSATPEPTSAEPISVESAPPEPALADSAPPEPTSAEPISVESAPPEPVEDFEDVPMESSSEFDPEDSSALNVPTIDGETQSEPDLDFGDLATTKLKSSQELELAPSASPETPAVPQEGVFEGELWVAPPTPGTNAEPSNQIEMTPYRGYEASKPGLGQPDTSSQYKPFAPSNPSLNSKIENVAPEQEELSVWSLPSYEPTPSQPNENDFPVTQTPAANPATQVFDSRSLDNQASVLEFAPQPNQIPISKSLAQTEDYIPPAPMEIFPGQAIGDQVCAPQQIAPQPAMPQQSSVAPANNVAYMQQQISQRVSAATPTPRKKCLGNLISAPCAIASKLTPKLKGCATIPKLGLGNASRTNLAGHRGRACRSHEYFSNGLAKLRRFALAPISRLKRRQGGAAGTNIAATGGTNVGGTIVGGTSRRLGRVFRFQRNAAGGVRAGIDPGPWVFGFRGEVMRLSRNGADDTDFVFDGTTGEPVLSHGDLDSASALGGRYTLQLQNMGGNGLELSYFSVDDINSARNVTNATPVIFGGTPAVASPSYNVSYNSELQNIEANGWLQYNRRLRLGSGFRYVGLDEDFDAVGAGTGNGLFAETRNDLFGWQALGNYKIPIDVGWDFEIGGRGGFFYNRADVSFDSATRDLDFDGDSFSTVFDFNVGLAMRLTRNFKIRAGYQVFFLNNVALAPNQSTGFNVANTSAPVRFSNAQYDGGYIGATFNY